MVSATLRRLSGAALLLIALALVRQLLRARRYKRLPPGPPVGPLLGLDGVLMMARHYDHYMDLLTGWHAHFGDTFALTAVGRTMMIVSRVEDVQHFLAKNFENYEKSPQFMTVFNPMLGKGIFNVNGDIWRHHRSTARPHFAKVELGAMVPTFDKHAALLIDKLSRSAETGEAFDIQDLFFRFTLDSVGDILFGINIGSLEKRSDFASAFDVVQDVMALRVIVHPWWQVYDPNSKRLGEALKVVRGFVDGIVRAAEEDPNFDQRKDLLSEYIREGVHSRDYLMDMLQNMLIAGRDTTAALLSHLFFELTQHPDVESKLVAEIDSVIGRDGTPTPQNLRDLKFMKMVLNETLRLHPSVPGDFRTAVNDDVLPSGYDVPAGTDIAYIPYLLHRKQEYWGDDAEIFDPDRWVADRIRKVPPFAFAPFLAGPRICLGQNMAYTEAKLTACRILQKFKIRLVDGQDLDYKATLILSFRHGLKVTVEKRE